jgi:hypothetical protein
VSAPSVLHEGRVELLEDLATLAGYTVDAAVWFGLRPDVVRLHSGRPALLVGDAKASERSTGVATRTRLHAYVQAAREWMAAGFRVYLAVVHGPDGGGWLECLDQTAESAGVGSRGASCQNVGGDDWVSLTELVPGRRRSGGLQDSTM